MEDASMEDVDLNSDSEWEFTARGYDGDQTPTSTDEQHGTPDFAPRAPEYDHDLSDAESDEEYSARMQGELAPKKKRGGYDSRIEQMLYENPQLPILITDAGRSVEGSGKYIVYTIRTGVG